MSLTAVLCVLLAIIASLDAYGIFATVLFALAVAAHLIGAALGHQLRAHGDQPLPARTTALDARRPVSADEFAPTTQLSRHQGPGRWVIWHTAVWCLLGAIAGGVLMLILCGDKANVTNISAGAIAFAVLGAIWGFALGAFLKETIGAWLEAHKTK